MATVYCEDDATVIRRNDCSVLLSSPGTRCNACTKYRLTLNALLHKKHKKSDDRSDPSSHTNFRYLNTPQKMLRMRRLNVRYRNTQARVKCLKQNLARAVQERGISVDDEISKDMVAIMAENSSQVASKYAKGRVKSKMGHLRLLIISITF